MTLKKALQHELKLRMDSTRYEYERLLQSGADRTCLERLMRQSFEIGIIKDKLENLKIRRVLTGYNEEEK